MTNMINFNGFLNRVTCKDAKLVEGLLQFETISVEDEEDGESECDAIDSNATNHNNQSILCGACENSKRDTVLLPGLHVYYCWQTWLYTDPDKFVLEQYVESIDIPTENRTLIEPRMPDLYSRRGKKLCFDLLLISIIFLARF